MAPTSNNEQVIDLDDSEATPERRRTGGTQPTKRVKKPARKENASEAGDPGKVQFPAGIPASVTKMLRDYFVKKQSNVVPIDIYYMQIPFGMNDKHKSKAAYFIAATNELCAVSAYHLPWMKNQPGGSSGHLLIAEHPSFGPGGNVLIRVKKNSNEFRIWRGVNDNPFDQALVVKKAVDDTFEHNGRYTGRGKSPKTPSTGAASQRKPRNQPPVPQYTTPTPIRFVDGGYEDTGIGQGGSPVPGSSPAYPSPTVGGVFRQRLPVQQYGLPQGSPQASVNKRKRNAVEDDDGSDVDYDGDNKYSSGRPLSSPIRGTQSAEPQRSNVGQSIHFHFDGPIPRMRTLATCDDIHKFFTQCTASELITSLDLYPNVTATLTGLFEGPEKYVIADQIDFDELVQAILADGRWNVEGAMCVVRVTKP
ncbi:uncharacterized protein AB675_3057 [Cyphellophora attinorum]|uniref:Uncharacterized protein n=1 Tax=Cyphellophora attinorum TaxID=1664694 RepID=A0A0N0NKD3_9EURO|nr:uncharacterized protein AB675_3057 [Phialophora attinorum]KPI38011.1 hypothetical protein AB675_3057 [Phialophora attinorum]